MFLALFNRILGFKENFAITTHHSHYRVSTTSDDNIKIEKKNTNYNFKTLIKAVRWMKVHQNLQGEVVK